MKYAECLQQIQKYLENNPVIILGSGSSAAYGLPLMSELGVELKQHKDEFAETEFDELCGNIDAMNFEDAIDKTNNEQMQVISANGRPMIEDRVARLLAFFNTECEDDTI